MNTVYSNYFDEFPSKSIAWEHCQDICWLFVMLDDSGYTQSVESSFVLRRYACQIARDYWKFLTSDMRKAIDSAEKSAVNRQFPSKTKIMFNWLLSSLFIKDEDTNLPIQDTNIRQSLELAKTAVNLEISAAIAAAITAGVATELGADPSLLIEKLKILVGNPYLTIQDQNIKQHWWIVPLKPKNPLGLFIHRLRSWLIATQEEENRKEFNRFLSEYISLTSAWDNCQNPNWMLAMIDLFCSSNQIPNLQNKLRKFVCFLSNIEWVHTSAYERLSSYSKKAIYKADQFADEKANLRDLKIAEIGVVNYVKNIDERYWYTTLFALLSVSPIIWDAVVEILRLSAKEVEGKQREINYMVQCEKLRELIENPFI